jgi:hypothetical protein
MKKKRPFTINFPDQTIILDTSQIPHREGIPNFGTKTKIKYIKENHPEKLKEYLDHLTRFKAKFDKIDLLLKNK